MNKRGYGYGCLANNSHVEVRWGGQTWEEIGFRRTIAVNRRKNHHNDPSEAPEISASAVRDFRQGAYKEPIMTRADSS